MIQAHIDTSSSLVALPSLGILVFVKKHFAPKFKNVNTFYVEILHAISNNSEENVDDLILCAGSKESTPSRDAAALRVIVVRRSNDIVMYIRYIRYEISLVVPIFWFTPNIATDKAC